MDGQHPADYVHGMIEEFIGVVVIGRNEGERLRACLLSLSDVQARVYVDSGSTDGSCTLAKSLGFDVVKLPMPPGFTAARARNAGIERLQHLCPKLKYVQTVDGDCEVHAAWLADARAELEQDRHRAVVFGRRRERRPNANIYHQACDDEWNVPLGEVSSCGGDALFRLAGFREVGGFNPLLIAGEEPDLCLRLRQSGWKIWSNGREMTLHDVTIERMSQWWRRSRRTGFAIAELVDIHQTRADPSWLRLLQSARLWSVVMAATLAAAWFALAWQNRWASAIAFLLGTLLIMQIVRLATRQKRNIPNLRACVNWACLMMITKAAQAVGWAQYKLNRSIGAHTSIIEYKK